MDAAERDLFASAAYFAGSRLRLEVQILEQRPEQGASNQWRQISAALALFQHTSLQVFATSSSTGFGNTFRIRLDQEIRPGFSLFVEAGNVVTFQSTTGPPDRSRLRIMVRRTWDVATPSAGTAVRGVVASSGALPTAGLPVELGPYRTVTDRVRARPGGRLWGERPSWRRRPGPRCPPTGTPRPRSGGP